MKAIDARKQIQTILGVVADGQIGPKSRAAFESLIGADSDSDWPPSPSTGDGSAHTVIASSFADPADVVAFRKCKAQGGSDQECFKVGDNGIGKWGDDCTAGSGPACALPPEDWEQFGASARRKKVLIKSVDTGLEVIAELKDTMPHRANIHNGAGIDLSYDTVTALGLKVPLMAKVIWAWA